jgi:AcrR family transcriptional regulator
MLYHYFGNKEALWLAVLEQAYLHIRGEERELDVLRMSPVDGMRRLIEFTRVYEAAYPELYPWCSVEICSRPAICAAPGRCANCTPRC